MILKKKKTHTDPLFVSVGAGVHQVPLIREARDLGFHIVGIDNNPRAPGMSLCHLKIQESATNYEDIFLSLRETLMVQNVRCVLSKSYGEAVKTACYLAEKFDIPLVPFHRIDDFIQKNEMKRVFSANNIRTPEYRILDLKNAKTMGDEQFPGVIKPLVGHGKHNVERIENAGDLQRFFAKTSVKKEKFIFEEFIDGDEIIAAGIVHDGTYHLVDISDKITSLPPYFIDILHISPSKYYHLRERVTETGQAIASAFGIVNSPLIMELRITGDGTMYCIEAVPEFGGEYLPDYLIPERTGYNFVRETINAVSGGSFTPPHPKVTKKNVVVRYITGRNGTIISSHKENGGSSRNLVFQKMFRETGDTVSRPATNHDRIGVVITHGKSRGDAIDNAEYAVEGKNIIIKNTPGS